MNGPAWQAVVLAGDRGAHDPVAAHFGVPCKALAPLAGRPLLAHVLAALQDSGAVDRIRLVGPRAEHLALAPWLEQAIADGALGWQAPEAGAAASALTAVNALAPGPILITTADHALLGPALVREFLAGAGASGADAAIGLATHAAVMAAFPGTRRTRIRLADGPFCGCNLFAVMTARGRQAVAFWQALEAVRKHPAQIARLLGVTTLARYLTGRLDSASAFRALGARAGARIAPVLLGAPQAAVDVDSPADHALAEAWLARLSAPPSPPLRRPARPGENPPPPSAGR